MTANTQPESDRDEKGRFVIGNNRGPGRPRGARGRLAGELLEALADDFSRHGTTAIQKVRETDTTAYLRIVTGLMPKEVIVAALHVSTKTTLEELTEAGDFATAYKLARNMIGAEPPMIDMEAEQSEIESDLRDCEFAHDDD
jgi:hypothetical protein